MPIRFQHGPLPSTIGKAFYQVGQAQGKRKQADRQQEEAYRQQLLAIQNQYAQQRASQQGRIQAQAQFSAQQARAGAQAAQQNFAAKSQERSFELQQQGYDNAQQRQIQKIRQSVDYVNGQASLNPHEKSQALSKLLAKRKAIQPWPKGREGPTLEDEIKERIHVDPNGNIIIKQPDGKFEYKPAPKPEKETPGASKADLMKEFVQNEKWRNELRKQLTDKKDAKLKPVYTAAQVEGQLDVMAPAIPNPYRTDRQPQKTGLRPGADVQAMGGPQSRGLQLPQEPPSPYPTGILKHEVEPDVTPRLSEITLQNGQKFDAPVLSLDQDSVTIVGQDGRGQRIANVASVAVIEGPNQMIPEHSIFDEPRPNLPESQFPIAQAQSQTQAQAQVPSAPEAQLQYPGQQQVAAGPVGMESVMTPQEAARFIPPSPEQAPGEDFPMQQPVTDPSATGQSLPGIMSGGGIQVQRGVLPTPEIEGKILLDQVDALLSGGNVSGLDRLPGTTPEENVIGAATNTMFGTTGNHDELRARLKHYGDMGILTERNRLDLKELMTTIRKSAKSEKWSQQKLNDVKDSLRIDKRFRDYFLLYAARQRRK